MCNKKWAVRKNEPKMQAAFFGSDYTKLFICKQLFAFR